LTGVLPTAAGRWCELLYLPHQVVVSGSCNPTSVEQVSCNRVRRAVVEPSLGRVCAPMTAVAALAIFQRSGVHFPDSTWCVLPGPHRSWSRRLDVMCGLPVTMPGLSLASQGVCDPAIEAGWMLFGHRRLGVDDARCA